MHLNSKSLYAQAAFTLDNPNSDMKDIMICGGYGPGHKSQRSLMVSTSLTGHLFAENLHEEENQLLSADEFIEQKYAFPLSDEILTREFVDLNVPSADKKALLLDLKQPRVELLGLVS